jgi:hypothetical protein
MFLKGLVSYQKVGPGQPRAFNLTLLKPVVIHDLIGFSQKFLENAYFKCTWVDQHDIGVDEARSDGKVMCLPDK